MSNPAGANAVEGIRARTHVLRCSSSPTCGVFWSGYRAIQLEAGVLGGKLYLAAYAQRRGASGLTFFDDDVTNFFSPHAAGKSAIFLTAVGESARRSHSAD